VVGERVREIGRDRADCAPDPPEVVEQARPLRRQLRKELGEPEDVDETMINRGISAAREAGR
jgi:hypothetical protein